MNDDDKSLVEYASSIKGVSAEALAKFLSSDLSAIPSDILAPALQDAIRGLIKVYAAYQEAEKERDRYVDIVARVVGMSSREASRGKWHVYYIRSEANGLIKIGFSNYPEGRRRTLESHGGSAMTLLAKHRGTKTDEAKLHRRFKALRERGEWFRPGPALLKHIASIAPGSSTSA
jgi:hypothetical protein